MVVFGLYFTTRSYLLDLVKIFTISAMKYLWLPRFTSSRGDRIITGRAGVLRCNFLRMSGSFMGSLHRPLNFLCLPFTIKKLNKSYPRRFCMRQLLLPANKIISITRQSGSQLPGSQNVLVDGKMQGWRLERASVSQVTQWATGALFFTPGDAMPPETQSVIRNHCRGNSSWNFDRPRSSFLLNL